MLTRNYKWRIIHISLSNINVKSVTSVELTAWQWMCIRVKNTVKIYNVVCVNSHLFTCKIYVGNSCDRKFKTLADLKDLVIENFLIIFTWTFLIACLRIQLLPVTKLFLNYKLILCLSPPTLQLNLPLFMCFFWLISSHFLLENLPALFPHYDWIQSMV